MQYTKEQIELVDEWLTEQTEDDTTFESHLAVFITLKQILINGEDPKSMFEYLMDWGLENIEHEN